MQVDEYCIISINDDRKALKADIVNRVGSYPRTFGIEFIDGSEASIGTLQDKFNVDYIWDNAKLGELGIWFSFLNVCQYAVDNNKTVLAFEDDAIITSDNFQEDLERLLAYVPEDGDVFSVMVPRNQHVGANLEWLSKFTGIAITHTDIAPTYRIPGVHVICRAYQGYSMVCMIYTPEGAKKILDRVQETGMYQPADCWVFEQHDQGIINVYTPVPTEATLVDIDWADPAPTTIQTTPVYDGLTDLP